MRSVHIDTGKEWRGGQSQVLMLAEGLMQRDHDVVLAVRKGGSLGRRAMERHIAAQEVPFRFEIDPGAALAVARLASKEIPTIYHAHTPHALGVAILAQQLGPTCPIVFTRRVSFPLKKFFVTRWKLNKPDRIIAVSHAVADEMVEGGIFADKIRVIHSAIDTRFFYYKKGPQLEEPLNIAISGSLERAKGLAAAMLFAEKCAGEAFRFHFAGGGPELELVKAWAANLPNIEVHGFVRDMDVFLQKMFAVMSFSPSEGFPNVVLQGMALGLPVLAFDNAAIREILQDNEFGRTFSTHDEAMAILQDWKSNKEEVASRGRQASEWVVSRYSQDMMVERTLALYKEMVP